MACHRCNAFLHPLLDTAVVTTVIAMSTATKTSEQPAQTVSRRLAAEDIQIGSHITVAQQVTEVISFLWCGETSTEDREQPVMYRDTPSNSGEPFKVMAVCLPFVFVEDLQGGSETIDLRHCEITLLSPEYVAVVKRSRRKARSRLLKALRNGRGKKRAKRRKK